MEPMQPVVRPSVARRKLADVPGPRGWPIVGNAFQIDRARMHLAVEAWTRRYGSYFRFRIGERRFLAVADHEVLAALMRDRPDGVRRGAKLERIWLEMGLSPGVFVAEGEAWRRQRRMVMAGFDPAHVRQYLPSLLQVGQRLRGRWSRAAQAGQTIDLQADLMRFTVDAIAGLAFGTEVNTLESDSESIQRHLDKIFPALFRRLMSPLPTWRWFRTTADRQLEHSVGEVRKAVDDFIARARQRMRADPTLRTHPRNLLEAMINAADQPDSGVNDADVAGNVLTMLLAGEDTTANTLAWMLYLLTRNPSALERAQTEVRDTIAGDEPSYHQLNSLDWIEACAHETMRLKPVAPFNTLELLRDAVVGDIDAPRGTVVLGLMRHDGMAHQYFPEPASFRPERWMAGGGAVAGSAKRVSMPFGAGPRVCPGRYLALMEIKLCMAMLLRHFDVLAVDTPDGGPAVEQLQFTMSAMGLTMRLRERA